MVAVSTLLVKALGKRMPPGTHDPDTVACRLSMTMYYRYPEIAPQRQLRLWTEEPWWRR